MEVEVGFPGCLNGVNVKDRCRRRAKISLASMLTGIKGMPRAPHLLDSVNDEFGPELSQGLYEHEWSKILQDSNVIELLRDWDKPAPLPRRADVLILPLPYEAVVRHLLALVRPAFDHVVAESRDTWG